MMRKKTDGFTLIEVIVSIAILSIVSVAIVQMFTVSARSNSKAYAMDKANALCTETAEHFKADPGFTGTGSVYTRYLDRDFGYTSGPGPSSGSVYKLDVTVTTSSAVTTGAFYYPDAAYEYEMISPDTSLTLTNAGLGLTLNVNGSGNPLEQGKIIYAGGKALIPVQLHWSASATSSAAVNIANEVKTVVNASDGKEYPAVADIYLCNVPSGAAVTVNTLEGAVAQQDKALATGQSQSVMYSAAVKITKLTDNSVLAENTVEKYWVK